MSKEVDNYDYEDDDDDDDDDDGVDDDDDGVDDDDDDNDDYYDDDGGDDDDDDDDNERITKKEHAHKKHRICSHSSYLKVRLRIPNSNFGPYWTINRRAFGQHFRTRSGSFIRWTMHVLIKDERTITWKTTRNSRKDE
jgi:hypothetical protein